MHFLDLRTLVFLNVAISLVCTLVMVQLWVQTRDRYHGISFLVANFAFQTTGLLLIVLRGAIPDWASIIPGNFLVIAGAIIGYIGLERFTEKKGGQLHNVILLVLFTGAHSYFTFIQPSLAMRNLNVSAALLIICTQTVVLLLYRVPSAQRPSTRFVAAIFAAYAAVNIIRIFVISFGPKTENDFFESGSFDIVLFIVFNMLMVILAYSLVLMINKRLIADVQTQEDKFYKAFHSSPYAITLTRMSDGKIIEVNSGFETMSGYTADEAVGNTTAAMGLWAAAEDRAAIIDEIKKCGMVHDIEATFRKKSGEMITTLMSGTLISIDGQTTILSSISDVSKRKSAETDLLASEVRYRRLFEAAKDGIIILDAVTGMIVDVNPFLIELLGFSHEQLLGKTIWDIGFFKEIIANKDKFAELQTKEYVRYEDLPLETADGRKIDVEFVSNVYEIDHKKVIQCNIRDITERIRAQEALRESEDKFKHIFDHSVIGKSITTPSGQLSVNNAFCAMLGYTREELDKSTWRTISHPDDMEVTQRMVASLLNGERRTARFTKRYIHKNGSTVWADVGTTLRRDKSGAPLYFITSVSDITEKKKAEDELARYREHLETVVQERTSSLVQLNMQFQKEIIERKRAEELLRMLNEDLERRVAERTADLAAKNVEMEQIIYITSHDLRSPLVNIQGFNKELIASLQELANMLDDNRIPTDIREQITGHVGKEMQESQRYINASVHKMEMLLSGLLKISRLGRAEFKKDHIDMNTLMADITSAFEYQIQSSKAVFIVSSLPPCTGDKAQIDQLFSNLIGNAIKYLDPTRPGTISVHGRTEGDMSVYCVEDNGIGIAREHQERIFEIFHRLDPEATAGEGIGLAVVRRIVDRCRGKVWLASVPGKGSAFYISIPGHNADHSTKQDTIMENAQ